MSLGLLILLEGMGRQKPDFVHGLCIYKNYTKRLIPGGKTKRSLKMSEKSLGGVC